jgi:hypothetical protein
MIAKTHIHVSQFRLDILFPSFQVGMLCYDWPGNSEESRPAGLRRKLSLRSHMEESEISCNKVMRDACSFV